MLEGQQLNELLFGLGALEHRREDPMQIGDGAVEVHEDHDVGLAPAGEHEVLLGAHAHVDAAGELLEVGAKVLRPLFVGHPIVLSVHDLLGWRVLRERGEGRQIGLGRDGGDEEKQAEHDVADTMRAQPCHIRCMAGKPIILDDRAQALARYPHARLVETNGSPLVYVSGISSRRPDNTWDGVVVHDDGCVERDIKEQTRAVLENIRVILRAAGGDLANVVDITVFLVDMKDYAGMNEVYNQYFTKQDGPARTTVAVHQLPHDNLLVEMKAVASL